MPEFSSEKIIPIALAIIESYLSEDIKQLVNQLVSRNSLNKKEKKKIS